MTDQQVEVLAHEPNHVVGLNPQDLTELGALAAVNGFTIMESRQLLAEIQQMSAQFAMASMPKILERIRAIQESRWAGALVRIKAMQPVLGYISRDRVVEILQQYHSQAPRM